MVLLALATGLGVLGVATTLTQTPLTLAPPPAAAAAATHKFYGAADVVLQTGDTTALHAAVAPAYVDHSRPLATPTGIAGFVHVLADLRTICSDCRLTTQDLAVSHDQAAVRVTIRGHRQVIAAGVTVEGLPLAWTALEVVRIVGGQVAGRWSGGDPLALAESPATTVPESLPAGSAEVQVARFVMRPGTDLGPFTTAGSALLVVEQGTVALTVDGVWRFGIGYAPESDPIHLEMTLAAGHQALLPPGLSQRLRNDGPEPAGVLILATDPIGVLPGG
jgi:predicted ester cyclase